MKIYEIITEIETAKSVTDMEKEIIQDISHRGGQIHPYYRRLDTYRAAEIAFGLFKGTVSQHQAISGALKQLGFKDPSTVMDNPEYNNKVGGIDDTKKDAIIKLEAPKSVQELKRVLGMINYRIDYCNQKQNHLP